MHSRKGLVAIVQFRADFPAQMLGIEIDQVKGLGFGAIPFELRRAAGIFQDDSDIFMLHAAILREKFESVAVERQMARGDHDGAVHVGLLEYRGHEHSGRGCHAAVQCIGSRGSQCFQYGSLDGFCRYAGVMSHGNAQFLCGFLGPFGKEMDESCGNAVRGLRRKVHFLIGNALHCDATYITAIGKLHKSFFWCHLAASFE